MENTKTYTYKPQNRDKKNPQIQESGDPMGAGIR